MGESQERVVHPARPEKLILASDHRFYRIVWYTYDMKKCISAWIYDHDLAKAWCKDSNRAIPSSLEETMNVSSLGGSTIQSMEKRIEEINEQLKTIEQDGDLFQNLSSQVDIINKDIQILKNNPNLVITQFLDFLENNNILDRQNIPN